MAVSTATERQGPDLEQDEYYDARIKSVDETENKFGNDPRVLLVWSILNENGKPMLDDHNEPVEALDGVTVAGKSGKRSKLYQIWNAVFFDGKGVPDDEEMDTDLLDGKRCRLLWGMVVNPNDKSERPGIVRYAAVKKAGNAIRDRLAKTIDGEDNE